MARLAVLERTTEKNGTQTAEMSVEEKQHLERMEEYRKLLYSDAVETEAPVKETVSEERRTAPSENVQRLADYKAYAFPSSKKVLFDGISYKDGALVGEAPVAEAPAYAPVREPEIAPAPAAAPVAALVSAPAEEDALPTRRTMAALRQTVIEAEEVQRTHFFAAVSTKAKVALAAIVFAIVVAIVVICINTGIINALDANIENLRAEAMEQKQIYEDMEQQLKAIENFEGPIKDLVTEYAEANGMIRK